MRAGVLALLVLAAAGGVAIAAAPQGAPATCGHQSGAEFPKADRDLKVGPLVLVGGRAYTAPETAAEFGGQKYPAVVMAGHRVTVAVPRRLRDTASLLYADDHGDGRSVGDGHGVVTFRACNRSRADSSYDGRPATFWSGFILTTEPRCLRLRVWVDDAAKPRRARVPLGRPCD